MIKKIGIYGGTFNPPHYGHIHAAEAFIEACALDMLIVMPALLPPHKQLQNDSPYARLEMARLAFSNSKYYPDRITVSNFEIASNQISYTYKTLEHFASDDNELYFLCGTDMFLSLGNWMNPSRIFELATIVLARREDEQSDDLKIVDAKKAYADRYNSRILEINYTPFPMSSTRIREAIEHHESIFGMLPENVIRYISFNNMYTCTHVLEEIIGDYLDSSRLKHTLSVAKECKKLAKMFDMSEYDSNRLYIAGLLHDITKCMSYEEHLYMAQKYRIRFIDADLQSPQILHQFTGAKFAQERFPEYTDFEICSAISCHTTGRRVMSLMDKLLFLADFIEPERKYSDCVNLRDYFYSGFSEDGKFVHLDQTVLRALESTKRHVEEKNLTFHPLSRAAMDALKNNLH